MVPVGQILGGLSSGALAHYLGRRPTVLISSLVCLAGWVAIALPDPPRIWTLLLGRVTVGLGMGVEGSLHSVYVCETTSGRWRGAAAATGTVVITAGILGAYVLGSVADWQVL